ncbi:MAG: HAD family hydrolase [Deltaproteobacteria bacterium]|nr:HAD family hydrolase [Deltaproteobacteria bacterium]
MVNTAIPLDELRRRARTIAVVFTDCDGVLTDGSVYYDRQGESMLRFSRRDGMGVERLRAQSIEVAILTRETSPIVEHRAAKLSTRLFAGVKDKRAAFPALLREMYAQVEACAFIGDDVNDLDLLRYVTSMGGLSGAPADARPEVRDAVLFVTEAPGGEGAFREFAEWILQLRGATS